MTNLEYNKTVTFFTPLDPNLVRTGTLEESCFLHALMHACSSTYRRLDKDEKVSYVNKIKSTLNLTNLDSLTLTFHKYIKELYDYIFDETKKQVIKDIIDPDDLPIYKVIFEIMDKDHLLSILPKFTENYSKDVIKAVKTDFEEALDEIEDLPAPKRKKLISKLIYIIELLLDSTDKYTKQYLDNKWDDSKFLTQISNNYDRDLYFIDFDTREVHKTIKSEHKNRKSVIFLVIKDHLEIMGRIRQGTSNVIDREFDPFDPFIEKLKSS